MIRSRVLPHLRQKFPPKRFIPKTPAPPHRFEFLGWPALPSRFHGLSLHKRLPIPVVPENRIPVITTVHDTCPAVALAERDGIRLPDTLFSTFGPLPNPKIRPHSFKLQYVRTDPFTNRSR